MLYRYTATAKVRTSVLSVSIRTRAQHSTAQHSTAQHSAITPAQSKPSACRPEYVSKEVCTYMHVAFGLFAWSMELLHLQVACLRQKSWAIYDISHSNPFFFVSERRPPTTRSVIRFTLGWVID